MDGGYPAGLASYSSPGGQANTDHQGPSRQTVGTAVALTPIMDGGSPAHFGSAKSGPPYLGATPMPVRVSQFNVLTATPISPERLS